MTKLMQLLCVCRRQKPMKRRYKQRQTGKWTKKWTKAAPGREQDGHEGNDEDKEQARKWDVSSGGEDNRRCLSTIESSSSP